jgi:hypothetical protein
MMRFQKMAACCGVVAACLLLWPASSHAAGPPQQLYNKSIVLSWAAGYNWKDTDGASGHSVSQFDSQIYVSSAGRVFRQSSHGIMSRGRATAIQAAKSVGPNGDTLKTSNAHGNGSYSWSGRELIGVIPAESGAFHLRVTFDEAFRGCTLSFVSGKEENAPGIVKRSLRGTGQKLVMLTPSGNSGMSCSIRDGNVLGQ